MADIKITDKRHPRTAPPKAGPKPNPPVPQHMLDSHYSQLRQGYNHGVITRGELFEAARDSGRNIVDLTHAGQDTRPEAPQALPSRARGARFGHFLSSLRPARAVPRQLGAVLPSPAPAPDYAKTVNGTWAGLQYQ